jgi:hypothetical protein
MDGASHLKVQINRIAAKEQKYVQRKSYHTISSHVHT